MPRYEKTKDKNGRVLYWKVYKSGKRKRVSKKEAKGKRPGPKGKSRRRRPGPALATYLLSLPRELFRHTILQMDGLDVFHLCNTSVAFRNLCEEDWIWKDLTERDFPDEITDIDFGKKVPKTYKQLYWRLRTIHWTNLNTLTNDRPVGWLNMIRDAFEKGILTYTTYKGKQVNVKKVFDNLYPSVFTLLYDPTDNDFKTFATDEEALDILKSPVDNFGTLLTIKNTSWRFTGSGKLKQLFEMSIFVTKRKKLISDLERVKKQFILIYEALPSKRYFSSLW